MQTSNPTSAPNSAPNSAQLYEAIYVSTIAPGLAISSVADIAGKSRIANQQQGITGLLIFDGMRYCQQLEGPQKQVLKLMEKIRHDQRHVNVEIIHHGELASRRFKSFCLGYTTVADPEVLERLEKLDGQAAVSAFLALLSQVDYV
jgi:Sensors of blue-light using FAD